MSDMAEIEVTFERAFRIWWSYTWRTFVLTIPVMLLAMLLLPDAPSVPADGGGAVPSVGSDPMAESSGGGMLIMLVILPLNIVMQVQALRWMLRTRWREFYLRTVARDESA